MLASGFVGIMVILICIPGSRYVLIDRFFLKIIDISDASTQHRYSTIWNDLLILVKFPVFGIGDGNQGFFYAYHVSGTWMARNLETQAAIKGELGLLNGGAAIPSFISGFGVFGIAALFVTMKRIFAKTKDRPALSSSNRIYYLAGIITLFFALFVSNGFHRTYLVYLFLTSYFLLTNIDDDKISWIHAIMSRHDYGNCSCDQIEI